jgi:polyribonucleotide nucleotidyltransferase
MSMEKVKTQVGNQEFTFETGRVAKQASGSVLVQCGGTVILATAVSARKAKEGQDFFPLTVDYRERSYAAGKIPGGYFKREGRPTEREILTSRLIDRPIRPLFPADYFNEVQVMVVVLSSDAEIQPDILAMNGASAALMLSDIPYSTPLAAVRVGLMNDQFVINPSIMDLENSQLDLIIAGSDAKIIMIEAGAKEITEEKMLEALEFGHKEIKKLIAAQMELVKKAGLKKKAVPPSPIPKDVVDKMRAGVEGEFEKIYQLEGSTKEERENAAHALYEKLLGLLDTKAEGFKESWVKMTFDKLEQEKLRDYILKKGKRPDGRGFSDIRQITCEIGVLPRTHGSSIFTRGQTQSLGTVTLGTGEDEQKMETLEGEVKKRFMLHYNFPPFSVGECGRNSGPGRREIGHGALAQRSLEAIIPSQEDFPYTIRIVSDILESNGSSSMASVCSGTLALLDAGVPIKAPVSGIAMGLVTSGGKWQVLTDIAGVEDHHGDMDFKAAGTRNGLTALQMDLKVDGVTFEMLRDFFTQSKTARFKIMEKIEATIASPRKELSEYAPRIVTLRINPEKIGELIGPGGKNIRKIVEETGAKIDIEDDGRVFVASTDAAASEAAVARIQGITAVPEIGKIYQGTVRKLMAFGAFIEVLPGKDGLCHVSEVSEGFVKAVNDYLKVGDVVPIKVVSVDDNGKVSLSIKQAKEGGMPLLPPDVERDEVSESAPRGRDRGPRSRR